MNTKLTRFFIVLALLVVVLGATQMVVLRTLSISDSPYYFWSGLFELLYGFTPLAAVWIVEKGNLKQLFANYLLTFRGMVPQGFWKYLLLTLLLLPVLLLLLTYLGGNLAGIGFFGQLSLDASHPHTMNGYALSDSGAVRFLQVALASFGGMMLQCIVGALTLGVGGELAWRGFLQKELGGSFTKKQLLIGLIWALWGIPKLLAPVYMHGYEYLIKIGVSFLSCIVLSFYLAHALRESRTLLTPILLHGAIPGVYFFSLLQTGPATDSTGHMLLNGWQILVPATILLIDLLFARRKQGGLNL